MNSTSIFYSKEEWNSLYMVMCGSDETLNLISWNCCLVYPSLRRGDHLNIIYIEKDNVGDVRSVTARLFTHITENKSGKSLSLINIEKDCFLPFPNNDVRYTCNYDEDIIRHCNNIDKKDLIKLCVVQKAIIYNWIILSEENFFIENQVISKIELLHSLYLNISSNNDSRYEVDKMLELLRYILDMDASEHQIYYENNISAYIDFIDPVIEHLSNDYLQSTRFQSLNLALKSIKPIESLYSSYLLLYRTLAYQDDAVPIVLYNAVIKKLNQ